MKCDVCNGEGFLLMECETMWTTCKVCIGKGTRLCGECQQEAIEARRRRDQDQGNDEDYESEDEIGDNDTSL